MEENSSEIAYFDQPPSYQESTQNERLTNFINKYEVSQLFADKLMLLSNFKIVFIFDDSGSMNSTLSESPLNTGNFNATRWDELQYFSKISIELANIFNHNGTDIYFLNRPPARNIRSADELVTHFHDKPSGYTQLTPILNEVLNNNNRDMLADKKLLIIIVTDGEPTDFNGRVDIKSFKEGLNKRNNRTFTTIVSCTDDEETMKYLNNWDIIIPRLDVVDDYRSEKREVQNVQGKSFSFSFGDYVTKALLGSIDESIDNLDQNLSLNLNFKFFNNYKDTVAKEYSNSSIVIVD
ncbi:unnamed protein product [Brachionus calyciflorus]|uniref:VWFA domain-containing protein n=1 Tax=Brachionus calyciflorus TaxID=104777 RepID=A0A813XA38_9BILA|nr:unnamed protein product [Brachionus calyciflorus]